MDHGIWLIIKIIIHIIVIQFLIQYRRIIRLIVLLRDRDPGKTGVYILEPEFFATFLLKLGFYNKRNLRLTVFDFRPGLISAVL